MKRILTIIAAALLGPAAGWAQAQLMTKKMDIGDVSSKITKVVLSGDALTNLMLKDDIEQNWTVSPYEFCTLEEFENIKCDTNYFFLMRVMGQFKKEQEPSAEFLTLLKGGPAAKNGIDKMTEVIALPIKSSDDDNDRYITLLPAFLNIIQEHIPRVTRSDMSAYTAIYSYSRRIPETKYMTILFCADDLSTQIDTRTVDTYFDTEMIITDECETDKAISEMWPNTLVSYTIYSRETPGRYCYKMLISTENYELYYFKKHKVSKRNGPGFLIKDIGTISGPRDKE